MRREYQEMKTNVMARCPSKCGQILNHPGDAPLGMDVYEVVSREN